MAEVMARNQAKLDGARARWQEARSVWLASFDTAVQEWESMKVRSVVLA